MDRHETDHALRAAALKESTRRQVRAAGGIEAAASYTRVGKSEIAAYQSTVHESRFMPVDVLADLLSQTGGKDLLHTLAGMADCTLMPIQADGTSLNADIANLAERVSSVFRDFAFVCGRENPDSELMEQLDRDLEEAVRVAMHARTILRDMAKNAAP